ncbi:phosphotransferase family protein [Sporichthya sp.]|uniref:phosphotransferase family protein n=1 Tax=Sporichthya sp. TaxID=65475 RepID=UPI00180D7921|nr:phosphotransferase family protein [Sporichthya sp.]MBA3742841.1 phosphotransferase family protein [Sporichthya sp.]
MSAPTAQTAAWTEKVLAWLPGVLPGDGAVELEPLVAGHSNLVFALRRGEQRYILRRPPMGEYAASAHDVLREARLLTVLAEAGSTRTPRVVAIAEAGDAAGVGPAYVMTRLPGVAIRNEAPAWLDSAAQRATISRELVGALAELHALPIAPFEAAKLGRPGGYLARQLTRWSGQRDEFVARGGRALDDEPAVRAWLQANVADEGPSTLVHGDFKLDNVLVDPDTCGVTCVLDWEMATLGDPLADLGFLLAFWPDSPAAAAVFEELLGEVTLADGFLDRAAMVGVYAELSGRKVTLEDLRWYHVLALWKMALLLEASYTRHLAGTTDDPFFACLDTANPRLLAAALELARSV